MKYFIIYLKNKNKPKQKKETKNPQKTKTKQNKDTSNKEETQTKNKLNTIYILSSERSMLLQNWVWCVERAIATH